jgi:hypothetical protein
VTKWNDFTAEVEGASGGKAPGCSVGNYIKALTREGREAIEAAFGRPELTTAAIGVAMRNRGADVSDYTIGRHRRRICSCKKNGQ